MDEPQLLRGRTIVVTRPEAQAGELAAAIRAQGGEPLLFPLLEISPVADQGPLADAAAHLERYDLAVFVSPNAVHYALPLLLQQRAWPANLQAVAVGPGTVKALALAGVGNCLCPTARFDSEALLALPELAEARLVGKRVVIFRGNGGRELLGDTLTARGAQVERIACYQRSGPGGDSTGLLQRLRAGTLDALVLSSSEALGYLLELAPDPAIQAALKALPLFVPHQRIAEKAQAAGFARVVQTGPADAGLLAGLCAYNWLRS